MKDIKENKLISVWFLFFAVLIFTLGFVIASSSGTLKITAKITPNVVGISVPNNLTFYNVTSGYKSEKESIELKNTGNVNISVSVSLDDSYSGKIFTNLEFSNESSPSNNDYKNFSDFFVIIEKPSTFGGEKKKTISSRLNLEGYDGTFSNAQNFSVNVIFTAVEA